MWMYQILGTHQIIIRFFKWIISSDWIFLSFPAKRSNSPLYKTKYLSRTTCIIHWSIMPKGLHYNLTSKYADTWSYYFIDYNALLNQKEIQRHLGTKCCMHHVDQQITLASIFPVLNAIIDVKKCFVISHQAGFVDIFDKNKC